MRLRLRRDQEGFDGPGPSGRVGSNQLGGRHPLGRAADGARGDLRWRHVVVVIVDVRGPCRIPTAFFAGRSDVVVIFVVVVVPATTRPALIAFRIGVAIARRTVTAVLVASVARIGRPLPFVGTSRRRRRSSCCWLRFGVRIADRLRGFRRHRFRHEGLPVLFQALPQRPRQVPDQLLLVHQGDLTLRRVDVDVNLTPRYRQVDHQHRFSHAVGGGGGCPLVPVGISQIGVDVLEGPPEGRQVDEPVVQEEDEFSRRRFAGFSRPAPAAPRVVGGSREIELGGVSEFVAGPRRHFVGVGFVVVVVALVGRCVAAVPARRGASVCSRRRRRRRRRRSGCGIGAAFQVLEMTGEVGFQHVRKDLLGRFRDFLFAVPVVVPGVVRGFLLAAPQERPNGGNLPGVAVHDQLLGLRGPAAAAGGHPPLADKGHRGIVDGVVLDDLVDSPVLVGFSFRISPLPVGDVVEEVLDGDGRSDLSCARPRIRLDRCSVLVGLRIGHRCGFLVAVIVIVVFVTVPVTGDRSEPAHHHQQPADHARRGQGLPPEPEGSQVGKVVDAPELAGRVPRAEELQIPLGNPPAVVDDRELRQAVELDDDPSGAGVQGILEELLDDRHRALDDLPRRDLVDDGLGKDRDPGAPALGPIVDRRWFSRSIAVWVYLVAVVWIRPRGTFRGCCCVRR